LGNINYICNGPQCENGDQKKQEFDPNSPSVLGTEPANEPKRKTQMVFRRQLMGGTESANGRLELKKMVGCN